MLIRTAPVEMDKRGRKFFNLLIINIKPGTRILIWPIFYILMYFLRENVTKKQILWIYFNNFAVTFIKYKK